MQLEKLAPRMGHAADFGNAQFEAGFVTVKIVTYQLAAPALQEVTSMLTCAAGANCSRVGGIPQSTITCPFAPKAMSLVGAQAVAYVGSLYRRVRGTSSLNQNKKIMAFACERLAREQMVSFEDFLSLFLLNSAYWAVADGCSEQPVKTLFARTAHLKLGSVDLRGVEAIRLFFDQRAQKNKQSTRVTRHISSAFVPAEYKGNTVSVRSIVAVFAGSGELPIPSDVPATIADVEDVFVRNDDGKWLFKSRFISPIFVGASAAAFAR